MIKSTKWVIIVIASAVLILYICRNITYGSLSFGWWWKIILLAAIAGIFGGIAAVVSNFELDEILFSDGTMPRKGKWLTAIIVASVGGAGGAIAWLTPLILQGKITDVPPTDQTKILVFSTCLVAGFLGTKLLRKLADKLDPRTEAYVDKKLNAASRQVDRKLRLGQELQAYILQVWEELEHGTAPFSDKTALEYIQRLEKFRDDFPEHRQLTIFLARLYSERLGKLSIAIDALSKTIEYCEQNKLCDENLAALLFNRACYRCKLIESKVNLDEEQKGSLYGEAAADLLKAEKCDPQIKADAADAIEGVEFVTFKSRHDWPWQKT